jgi:PRTRC genetic system protein C
MEITALKRVFKFTNDGSDLSLDDPNPEMTPEEVLDHYSNEYPKLSTAVVTPGVVKGETMEFEIKDNFGDKG